MFTSFQKKVLEQTDIIEQRTLEQIKKFEHRIHVQLEQSEKDMSISLHQYCNNIIDQNNQQNKAWSQAFIKTKQTELGKKLTIEFDHKIRDVRDLLEVDGVIGKQFAYP